MLAEELANETGTGAGPRLSGHEALRYARETMDDAIIAPAGNEAHWAEGLRDALATLADILHRHRTASEAPGGSLDDMARLRPRLISRIERARSEHLPLFERAESLHNEIVRQLEAGSVQVARVRADAGALQDDVRHHMAAGLDLIYEVYFRDMGGEG